MSDSYLKLFPNNLKKYKNLSALSLVFERIYKETIINSVEKIGIYKNLSMQDDSTLDQIALGFAVENYNKNYSKDKKIGMIKKSIEIHRLTGTKKGIENAMRVLDIPITVVEWFEDSGKPYTFKLVIEGEMISEDEINKIYELIKKHKNVRSHLEGVIISKQSLGYCNLVHGQQNYKKIVTCFVE